MDKQEMDKLNQEELDNVAGGNRPYVIADYQRQKCPNCGGKYEYRGAHYAVGNGGPWYSAVCSGCGHTITWGHNPPDTNRIGADGMRRGAAENGMTQIPE